MEDYPRNIMEFEERFSSEKDCREYLFQIRWPDGFKCPRCQHNEAWTISDALYRCKKCEFKIYITAGTIFQDTRKPLRLWFRAMWSITNQKFGISALGLQKSLGMSNYRTALTWMHKLRHAMVRPGRDRISGIIEVDETYIGGKKAGKRGRGAEGKVLIVIGAQIDGNHIGRIRLKRVSNASGKNLERVIQQTIELGSVVRTDGWDGYSQLGSIGYVHEIVREDVSVGKNLLPKCNMVASLLKRWLLGIHQGAVHISHIDYYLDEFTFRFNRRTSASRGKLFYRLIQQAVNVNPVHSKDLIS